MLEENKEVKEVETTEEVKVKNLNESIISIRVKLQNSKLKKSGKNKFAGFDYFELKDFLPKLNELMLEEGVNDLFTIDEEQVILTLIKGEERQSYKMPFTRFDTPLTFKKDKAGNFIKDKNDEWLQVPSMQDIQYLGALNTYYKRYLYLNAFGITDGEVIDNMNNDEITTPKKATTEKKVVKASPKQIELIQKLVSDIPAMLSYYRVENIEDLTIEQASEIISKKKGVK